MVEVHPVGKTQDGRLIVRNNDGQPKVNAVLSREETDRAERQG